MMNSSAQKASDFRRVAHLPALLMLLQVFSGCDAGLAECTVDSDCDQSQACEVSECVPVCGSDDDCADDEVCLTGLTTEQRVCREPVEANNASVQSRFALVRDTTEGAGCENNQPGSDLAFVLLEDKDGGLVAWGRVVSASINMEGNDFSTADHISGMTPEAGADSCPVFDDDHVVSLGCGGWLALEFVDEASALVDVVGGALELRVGEFGAQCDGGDELDRYEVLLCPEAEETADLPDACTIAVGVGQGERAFGF